MSVPGTYNFSFVQGDDVTETFTFKDADGNPIDLLGYTFAAQIRNVPADADPLATFTCTITDLVAGTVQATLAHTVTAGLPAGVHRWDMQWTDTLDQIRTLLAGKVTVLAEVTRP